MRYLLGLSVGLGGLWLLLSGHYSPLLLSFGAVSCAFTVLLCHRMGLIDSETVPLHLLARAPGYLFWLGVQVAKSNWSVARCVLAPGRQISPTMITLRTPQRTELGQVIYANSITLTPGTVTVGLRDGIAEVHALVVDNARELQEGEMARRVLALEGDNPPVHTVGGT